MIRFLNRFLCVVAVLLLSSCEQQTDFYDTEGNGYSYDSLQGKWLVVNYWATWCGPCIKEIPELNELAAEHANVLVLGVNYDAPDPQRMAQDITKMGIAFPVYAESPHAHFGVEIPQVLPSTLLIDPSGNLKETLIGPQTEASLLGAMDLTGG